MWAVHTYLSASTDKAYIRPVRKSNILKSDEVQVGLPEKDKSNDTRDEIKSILIPRNA